MFKYLNILLIVLILISALTYVVWANIVTVHTYSLSSLQDELNKLNETHALLANQKSLASDPGTIKEYARDHGMVEAGNISYIFESGDVALEQGNQGL